MLRCTIEIVPGGDESRKRQIGMVEIANVGGTEKVGNYLVLLKKTAPFKGALKAIWRRGDMIPGFEDEEVMVGKTEGFQRKRLGCYDLLYRALRELLYDRNKDEG